MNLIRHIVTLLWLMLRNLVIRLLGVSQYSRISHDEFVRQFSDLLLKNPLLENKTGNDEAGCESVQSYQFFEMSAEHPPWLKTTSRLAKGQEVSTFAIGRVYLSRALNLWVGPAFQLWYRMGSNGSIFRGARDTNTFKCHEENDLYLGGLNPGSWSDEKGGLAVKDEVYRKGLGSVSVLMIVWKQAARPGLEELKAKGDVGGLLAAELRRMNDQIPVPEGWSYLWELGRGEMYQLTESKAEDKNNCSDSMICHTSEDVGILRKETSCRLTPSTRLKWQWKVEQLPSDYAEDTVPTHDYLSLAVEFENGRDLSYYWSSTLPKEMSYHCPLPNWNHRETHLVIRSGSEDLGTWLQEDRNSYEDYRQTMGDPPERIVRVWFIAVSIFQHGEGKCEYKQIELVDGQSVVKIL